MQTKLLSTPHKHMLRKSKQPQRCSTPHFRSVFDQGKKIKKYHEVRLRHIMFIFEATPYVVLQLMIEKASKHFRTQPQTAPSCSSSSDVRFVRHTRREHNVPATAWLADQWQNRTEEDVGLPAFRLAALTDDLTKTGWGSYFAEPAVNAATVQHAHPLFTKHNPTRV